MKTSSTPFPYFVPNQLLRSSHLNDLVNFLDESSRFTRVFSMGIGIVQGLTVSLGTNANGETVVKIAKGFGLSSDGFLFRLEQDCEFTHYRVLKVSSRAFDCGVSQEDRFGFENQQTFFQLKEEADIPPGEVGLYEPIGDFDEVDANGDAIDIKCLTVVMLSTLDTFERAVCFNECEDNGADSSVTIKVLLADAKFVSDKIKPAQSTGEDQVIQPAGNPPVLRRLGWNGQKIQLAAIQTFEQLAANYLARCQDARPSIKAAYQDAFDAFSGKLPNVGSVGFAELEDCLQTKLDHYSDVGIQNIQYLYDFFKDLLEAFVEFAEALRGLRSGSQLIPDPCQFPGFIALGRVAVHSGCQMVERFRTDYQAASLVERDIGNAEKAGFLLNKMGKLCSHVSTEGLPNVIKITASRGRHLPLSQRAIPFYYNDITGETIREIWNFELKEDGQSERIPSYHRFSITAPFDEHLNYDVEAYAFFRIEGHVGHLLSEAVTKIEELRQCFNLPFDIKCVKLGTIAQPDEKKKGVQFTQLELIYENTRCDLMEGFPNFPALPETLEAYCANPGVVPGASQIPALQCYLDLLSSLCEEYRKLTFEVLFPDFVQKHPGTEHFGGVPKGGTFIIAYRDEPAGLATHNIPLKRVVADFCLPYYCCDGMSAASVIIEPLVYIYPKEFCKGDTDDKYQVLVYPPGGTLQGDAQAEPNSPHYLQIENGEHFFYPNRVLLNEPGTLEVTFTYQLSNGREASTSVAITLMELFAEDIRLDEVSYNFDPATCRLIGQNFNLRYGGSQGTVSQWLVNNMPAGSANPQPHTFLFTNPSVVVGVAVLNNACISKGEKTALICPQNVSLDVTGTNVSGDDGIYLVQHDGTTAQFNLEPKTGTAKLPGNNFTVSPAQITLASGQVLDTLSFLVPSTHSDCHDKTYSYNFTAPLTPNDQSVELTFSFELGCTKAQATVVIVPPVERPDPVDGGGGGGGEALTEEAITLLNRRNSEHKAVLRAAEGSRTNISESSGFAKSMNFIFSQGLPAADLDKQFNDTANALFRLTGGSDVEKVALAGSLLDSTFHSYLDKRVALSPGTASKDALELVAKIAGKMKEKGLDPAATANSWKGGDLKKTLKAKVVDEFLNVMKL
jgi:hypothetical protein